MCAYRGEADGGSGECRRSHAAAQQGSRTDMGAEEAAEALSLLEPFPNPLALDDGGGSVEQELL